MGVEIDVLSIGEGDAGCGDAFAIRLTEPGRSWVIVIDGGYSGNGDDLVQHVNTYFGTNCVDLLISTHPDGDHCGGLCAVVEKMQVREAWMHQPWNYSQIASLFHNGKIRPGRVRDKLRASLEAAKELDALCRRKGITPLEPFAGRTFGTALTVLGPSQDYYATLVADFACLPAIPAAPASLRGLGAPGLQRRSLLSASAASAESILQGLGSPGVQRRNLFAASAALQGIAAAAAPPRPSILAELGRRRLPANTVDRWLIDNLANRPDDVTPENNSSAVIWLSWDGYQALFTGDTGVAALNRALDYATGTLGLDPRSANLSQIPHHGSRHNVSPQILNRLLGPIIGNHPPRRVAFVSAPRKGGPKHPSKRVMNAYRRRGASVVWNQNYPAMRFWHNVPFTGPLINGQGFQENVEEVED